TNPIQITFNSFDVNGTHSVSTSHNKIDITDNNYIPSGSIDLHNAVRNFYYAKVTPDRFNYPRVYTTISRVIRTPLSVDIFCDVNSSYCATTGVINNTLLTGTTREQNGLYISINHNGDIDGNVTQLIDNPNGTITKTPDPTSTNPMTLPNGHNGMESAKFINCNNEKVEITIVTDPVLAYQPNKYILNCTDNNASQWTGIGQTGNVLEVKPKVHRSGKMDW
ncbi:MAG: hypothetical protein KAU90_10880, partial [Sulfurovaceae bacterium]|nr:hypothetical protein [Sulfurovaceae bacterium]